MLLCSKFWAQIYDWRDYQIIQINWHKRFRDTNLTPPWKTGTDLHQGWTALQCLCAVTASLCTVIASQLWFPSSYALFSLLARKWSLLALWKISPEYDSGFVLSPQHENDFPSSYAQWLHKNCFIVSALLLWISLSLLLCTIRFSKCSDRIYFPSLQSRIT